MSLSTPVSLDLNAAPHDFSTYNSIFTSINVPSSSPNSGTAIVQICSIQSSVRYLFCISQSIISSSFNPAIFKPTLTEYIDTTDENVI